MKYAISALLTKRESEGMIISRISLGFREAVSTDEAIGKFFVSMIKDFPSYAVAQIICLDCEAPVT